eukprot:TRINITY_DN3904_c0_g1_i1.p1 TRINITY_DN3904_c0_g1~~TRINITY_DN3904_c0_g1_i1.p1  ORF type:complete len:600 (-),score=134.46 TRINITY_DN3904_c0_g1_i1:39-1817(-)
MSSRLTPRKSEKEVRVEDIVVNNDGTVGVCPDGTRFKIPVTNSPMEWMRDPLRGSFFHWVWIIIFGAGLALLLAGVPSSYFVALFLFWRLAYNLGIGSILYLQSASRYFSNKMADIQSRGAPPQLIQIMSSTMGSDYKFNDLPAEFNAWVLFRGFVEVILALDLAFYLVMCLVYFEAQPFTLSTVASYILGAILCAFALWAKTDAYRVIGDFAWNWGDFFFLVPKNLSFNRVFSLFPHPMYTVGYSFYYGMSFITGSWVVLVVSLLAHMLQLLFLVVVEDPHISKTYGSFIKESEDEKERTDILYDKKTGYFRRDLIVFKNFFVLRSSDIFSVVVLLYNLVLAFVDLPLIFFGLHAFAWRVFHVLFLGWILYKQSTSQYFTKKFEERGMNRHDAFEEWKRIYNFSSTLTYVSFALACFKMFEWESFGLNYFSSARVVFGVLLLGLNLWSAVSSFETLGEFGWFFGDFFILDTPKKLYYTGIYRYLNDPDHVTGHAGFYGFALLSSSFSMFGVAITGQVLHWLFLKYVETPHMERLYGEQRRSESGFKEGLQEIIEAEKKNVAKINSFVKEIKSDGVAKATQKLVETLKQKKQ